MECNHFITGQVFCWLCVFFVVVVFLLLLLLLFYVLESNFVLFGPYVHFHIFI